MTKNISKEIFEKTAPNQLRELIDLTWWIEEKKKTEKKIFKNRGNLKSKKKHTMHMPESIFFLQNEKKNVYDMVKHSTLG